MLQRIEIRTSAEERLNEDDITNNGIAQKLSVHTRVLTTFVRRSSRPDRAHPKTSSARAPLDTLRAQIPTGFRVAISDENEGRAQNRQAPCAAMADSKVELQHLRPPCAAVREQRECEHPRRTHAEPQPYALDERMQAEEMAAG